MRASLRLLFVSGAIALSAAESAATTLRFSTPISGDSLAVVIEMGDRASGDGVDFTVSLPDGDGDLLGVFGNVVDEGLLAALSVHDESGIVTQWQIQADAVTKVGGGNTMSPIGGWDWGVRLGQSGSAGGAVHSASFSLVAPGLTSEQILHAVNQGWVIGVRIQGTPGAEGSSKLGFSGAAPRIRITTPVDEALLAASPAGVSGIVSGTAVTVDVSGTVASVTQDSFSADVSLIEGPNTLVATATNALGTASDAVDVVLDTTPPLVTIATPLDGLVTANDLVEVTGVVNDAAPIVAFSIASTPVVLNPDGSFAATVPLAPGVQIITAEAEDAAGNVGSAGVTVTRGIAPTIAISTPAANSLHSTGTIVLTGVVTGTEPISVSLGGQSVVAEGGLFSIPISLADGPHDLVAVAANAFGSASAPIRLTVDTTPPAIVVSAPADGAEFDESPIAITGTVADASPITELTLNGIALAPGASFSTSLGLVEGANPVTVQARDAAGNLGSASLTVTLASTSEPLAIAIVAPPADAFVSRPTISVTGSVSDPAATVVVNGVRAVVTGELWTAASVAVEEGVNTLTAVATRGSDSATAARDVIYNVAPRVVITTPVPGDTLSAASSDVHGMVDDPIALVDVNGVLARVESSGRWIATDVPLEPGTNRLSARAIDTFGAIGRDQVEVVRDDGAGPRLRVFLAYGSRLARYTDEFGNERFRKILFSNDAEYSAALESLGLPAEAFDPSLTGPAITNSFDVVVLSEEPGPVSLDLVYLDGSPTSSLQVFEGESGPIEQLGNASLFQFDEFVNLEVLEVGDFSPRYFTTFQIWKGFIGENPTPVNTPLVVTGVQADVSDDVEAFWDEQRPQLTVSSPEWGSVVGGHTVTLTGESRDVHGSILEVEYTVTSFPGGFGSVVIGAGSVPLIDGRFSIPHIALNDGLHNIRVLAADTAGNMVADNIRVTADPGAPAVTVVGPADGAVLELASVPIDLNFAAQTTLVSVNGVPDGRVFEPGLALDVFEAALVLGANSFQLEVDAGSGAFSVSFTLYRVEALAPLQIVSPAAGSFLNQSIATVRGLAPRGTPYVDVNGIPATFDLDGVTFTADVPIQPGSNEIRAVAPFGSAATITVRGDFLAPSLQLSVPADGSRLSESEIELIGLVSEEATVRLVGPTGEVSRGTSSSPFGAFAFGLDRAGYRFTLPPLALADGPNLLTLELVDRAGNVTTQPLTIVRTGAGLFLVDPSEGSAVPGLATDVTLDAVQDATIVAWYAAGRRLPNLEATALAAGTTTLAGIPLVPGANEMRVVYQRSAGVTETLLFSLESTATAAATVAGTVLDARTGGPLAGALVSVEVDGVRLIVSTRDDGSFAAVVAPGQVTVSIGREGFLGAFAMGSVDAGETFVADASLLPWTTTTGQGVGSPSGDGSSSVVGIVTDAATGLPLGGATVRVELGSAVYSVQADASGSYALSGIPAGAFQVTIASNGYLPRSFSVPSSEPVVVPLDAALQPIADSVALAGWATSALDGLPTIGAEVALLGTTSVAHTGPNGEFTLDAVPLGQQTLRFRKAGYSDRLVFLDLPPVAEGHPFEMSFTFPLDAGTAGGLTVGADAEGIVLEYLSGRPLAGAQVTTTVVGFAEPPIVVTTGSDGRFVVPGLNPGDTVDLTATAPDHEPETWRAVVVDRTDEVLGFDLVATIEGSIAGFVTDAASGDGILLAEIAVAGDSFLASASAGDGGYRLEKVPAGSYEIEVRHPAYLPVTVSDVEVVDGEIAPLDVELVHRPTTGALAGVVRDGATGAPLAGVQLTATGGAVTISGVDGSYLLSSLPAGLVEVTLLADGYPASLQTAAVDADLDLSTPTTREQDFALHPGGDVLVEASAEIAMGGGALELPDGSAVLHFLPLALSDHATVTLRRRIAPLSEPGAVLAVDPALELPEVVALGDELELLIESATPGSPAPIVTGAVLLELRYAAAEAAALGLHEDGAMPFYHDGAQWTLPRMLPHLHAVDTVNKRVVAGVNLLFTESGEPVTASVGMQPLQLAGFDLPSLAEIRQFVLRLGAEVEDAVVIDEIADLVFFEPDEIDLPENQWNANALPLLVFHGWSPQSAISDVGLTSIQEERYRQILQDLGAATAGVYRPVFVTYNPRMGLPEIAQLVKQQLEAARDDLRGVAPDPQDPESEGKAFTYVDGFGFSMGGLAMRSYQTMASSDQAIRSMVTMATPHHGALQLVRLAITGGLAVATGFEGAVAAETTLDFWSPGTKDLLDYNDGLCDRIEQSQLSGNPTLCQLNRNRRSAPRRGLSLIAGTRSGRYFEDFDHAETVANTVEASELLERVVETDLGDGTTSPLDRIMSLGFLMTGCLENDSVVCVWSAHAKEGRGLFPGNNPQVRALIGRVDREPAREDFDHFHGGEAGQSIADYSDEEIVPTLSDWVVGWLRVPEPVVTVEPTSTTPGVLDVPMEAHFNTHHGDIEGIVRVVYGGYLVNDVLNWRIIEGADAEGRPDPRILREARGTTAVPVSFTDPVSLPQIDPGDASTRFTVYRAAIVPIGRSHPTVPLVPEDGFSAPPRTQ